MDTQQPRQNSQREEHETSKDTANQGPQDNQSREDQDFKDEVERRMASATPVAGTQDKTGTALEEDDDSLARPENS